MPLVSVIIPVYNGARTLEGCLRAVMASRGVSCEVLVVDDGSTDATRQIAAGFPCRLIALPHNEGAACAKNRGAEQASGEFLFFTDADVHIPQDALAHVLENLADPQVDGVVGLLAETCPYPDFASQFKNLWMHFTYQRQPRRVGLFFTSVAAIRRDVFLAEGGFDAHYTGASITEDIEFGQRLLDKGYVVVMDKRIAVEHHKHYRLGEVLKTDLWRARGLMQTWLRNRVRGERHAHYASVPWYFGAGVGALGLATLMALLALFWGGWLWTAAIALVLMALVFNAPFLMALGQLRGAVFSVQSAAFLLADLFVSGLGILLGVVDALKGKPY